jgi:hypothetical protein
VTTEYEFKTAALEHLADISRAVNRIAAAREKEVALLAEALKIGGVLERAGTGLWRLTDAVNRNTNLGGR